MIGRTAKYEFIRGIKNMTLDPVDAVFVTYEPDFDVLHEAMISIASQVRNIYIIDNTPKRAECLSKLGCFENIEVIYLGENMGIAHAQNIGLKRSLKNNSNYILLSDQDTIYPSNYIEDMIRALDTLDMKVAAIAPLYKDMHRKKDNLGFLEKSYFDVKKVYPDSGLHEIFQAIASGKIIRSVYLKEIGLMDESLFIDWVDIEWCWRAITKGYKIIGNADVRIQHQLGEDARKIFFTEIPLRNPIRSYYITRNAVHLALRSRSINYRHKLMIMLKAIKFVLGISILAKPHFSQLRYSLLGFGHGIIGKLGKLARTD